MAEPNVQSEPLYSSLENDPDLMEIVAMFVDEMPGRIATIRELFASGPREHLRRAAHQLKGAAGSYGFDPISVAAGRLEQALLVQEPEEAIRQSVEELIALCARCRAGAASPSGSNEPNVVR